MSAPVQNKKKKKLSSMTSTEIKKHVNLGPRLLIFGEMAGGCRLYPLHLQSSWQSNNITLRNTQDVNAVNLPLRLEKRLNQSQCYIHVHNSESGNNKTRVWLQRHHDYNTINTTATHNRAEKTDVLICVASHGKQQKTKIC